MLKALVRAPLYFLLTYRIRQGKQLLVEICLERYERLIEQKVPPVARRGTSFREVFVM